MADSRDKPDLETLDYKPHGATEQPASAPPAPMGFNSAVIKPETRVNKTEVAEQPLEPLEFPEMCKNTKLIIKACKQVVRSAGDYESDKMTTPITVVQACEQLNCLLENIKNDNSNLPSREHHKDCECGNCPEQPNQNLMIITEIEGLMSQVNEKVFELQKMIYKGDKANQRYELISQALEEIDLFQKTTLFELRKAFE